MIDKSIKEIIILACVLIAGLSIYQINVINQSLKFRNRINISRSISENTVNKELMIINACENAEGTWLTAYKECESMASDKGLNQDECQKSGGVYSGCESACRHDPGYPDKVVCIAVCMGVCKFDI